MVMSEDVAAAAGLPPGPLPGLQPQERISDREKELAGDAGTAYNAADYTNCLAALEKLEVGEQSKNCGPTRRLYSFSIDNTPCNYGCRSCVRPTWCWHTTRSWCNAGRVRWGRVEPPSPCLRWCNN